MADVVIEFLCNCFYAIILKCIDMLPVLGDMPTWVDNTLNVLSYGLMFFPSDVFAISLGSIIFWLVAQLAWAIVEWVYKKIPGVD